LYSYYYYFTVSTHSWANPGKKILSKFKSRKIYKQTGIISIQSHLIHREGVFHNVLESNRFESPDPPTPEQLSRKREERRRKRANIRTRRRKREERRGYHRIEYLYLNSCVQHQPTKQTN